MPPDSPVSILVVDDHALVREAFTTMLKAEFQGTIVASAGTCAEALAMARANEFQIVLVDIELGDRSGLELMTELKMLLSPPRIIAVSMHQEETFVTRTMHLGARSYVTKDSPPQELFDAIRATMNGRTYISRELAQRFADLSIRKSTAIREHQKLSNRELEVLMQLARGKSLKEVAQDLSLSPRTVAVHKHNLCRKTGLKSTIDILRYCQSHGLA